VVLFSRRAHGLLQLDDQHVGVVRLGSAPAGSAALDESMFSSATLSVTGMPDLTERLEAVLAAGRALPLHGLVVQHEGSMVFEWYGAGEDYSWGQSHGVVTFGRETLHDLRSVTKSIVGLLYGIALDAGQVPEPNALLLEQFPEHADLATDQRRAGLSVGHVLTMTLGLEWNEDVPYTSAANSEIAMEEAPDRYRFVLERPIVEAPGTRWSYSGGATALLGCLIAKGTGEPLPDFARRALFEPLGITAFMWMTGGDGVASAASGLRLAPHDLARIGQVVHDGGRWQGRQVVPAASLENALRPHVRIADGLDYGYQWYLGTFPGGIRWVGAMGNGGQRLVVIPSLALVIAITAGGYDSADQATIPATILHEVVLPSFR
jgi:CubicO group peptidase (beta-lactamase class C family)